MAVKIKCAEGQQSLEALDRLGLWQSLEEPTQVGVRLDSIRLCGLDPFPWTVSSLTLTAFDVAPVDGRIGSRK